jgi:hypothetical protein
MAGEIATGMHVVADAAGEITVVVAGEIVAVIRAGATVAATADETHTLADAMDMRADAAHIRVDNPVTETAVFMAAKAKPEALAAAA